MTTDDYHLRYPHSSTATKCHPDPHSLRSQHRQYSYRHLKHNNNPNTSSTSTSTPPTSSTTISPRTELMTTPSTHVNILLRAPQQQHEPGYRHPQPHQVQCQDPRNRWRQLGQVLHIEHSSRSEFLRTAEMRSTTKMGGISIISGL